LLRLAQRLPISLAGVAAVTFAAHWLIRVNATTVGFAYLLLVLVVASTWGFTEAAVASVAATFTFNFFFLPPMGTLTIADPQNWVALFSFLATALIASRLSDKAERRAQDAIARREDVEHLYAFGRAILLIDETESFPKQLTQKLADVFPVNAAVLYDRRSGEIFRAGPSEFHGLDEQLRDAAWNGSSFSDPERRRVIVAVRLGSEPIAALALEGAQMPDSVVQGLASLVAIGLERARAQDLAHQVEAGRRSEQLRTTLLDAMAHEFKTPLTAIKAATTALLSGSAEDGDSRTELLTVADEEAEHLRELIDDAIEMARLDNAHIDLNLEICDPAEVVREAVASIRTEIASRPVGVTCEADLGQFAIDRRLVRLAIRQLLDNALKYSSPQSPVEIRVSGSEDASVIEVANRGADIPAREQARIFERFYRGAGVKEQIPGSGLGLSIAGRIVEAHRGGLTVESEAGETTFRVRLPKEQEGGPK
jgi:two-component system, OmpR family, sensor histidine kinase KdpD